MRCPARLIKHNGDCLFRKWLPRIKKKKKKFNNPSYSLQQTHHTSLNVVLGSMGSASVVAFHVTVLDITHRRGYGGMGAYGGKSDDKTSHVRKRAPSGPGPDVYVLEVLPGEETLKL